MRNWPTPRSRWRSRSPRRPFGLRLIKRSINRSLDTQGLRASLEAHFDTHQLSHLSEGFLTARDRGLASAIQKNAGKA